MWSLLRPTTDELDAELARVGPLPLSHAGCEIDLAEGAELPRGWHRTAHRIEWEARFEDARTALERFATHRLGWLFVHPTGALVAEGADVVVCARIGPAWSVNPCRITRVSSSPDRFEYTYATLPGHAEHGEESFSVARAGAGRVVAETVAVSRPQDLLARIGAPVAKAVQRRVKREYLAALLRETSG